MKAWLDASEPAIYVGAHAQVIAVTAADVRRGGIVPPSAVELVTRAQVVEEIRRELDGLSSASWFFATPGASRAINDVLDRAAQR